MKHAAEIFLFLALATGAVADQPERWPARSYSAISPNTPLVANLATQLPDVNAPLPLLILPTLKTGTHVYTNVVITHTTITNVSFNHSAGSEIVETKNLDPLLLRQLNAALFPCRQPPWTNSRPEIVAPRLYAQSWCNKPAPRFAVEQWITPAPNTLGKFVLIEFWSTRCEPCKADIGRLNELQAAYRDKLVVIGISAEPPEMVRDYYRRNPPTVLGSHTLNWAPIRFSVAADTDKRMGTALGITGIPHSILIDPRGIVRFEGMPHYLWQAIDSRGYSYTSVAGLNRIFARYSQ
jgi:cytochrome c biogenesis protein CcmG, thiol:disulfide interchange protein DsbE